MAQWKTDDDTLINFEVYGDSPGKETLLLLPGLLGAVSSQWRNFINPLAADYRVVLADLRGHGRSENREPSLRPERMMEDLAGLLDHLGAETVHIGGYSLGGYLGLMLHLHQPRRVATLLMHATKFYWTKDAVTNMRKQLDPDTMSARVPAYANQLAQEHGGSRWRMLVRQAADLVGYISEQGITEGMASRSQCPVLVSVGDRDELIPLQEAQRLSRVFPQGELLVLPGVRHPFPSVRLVPLLPMLQEFHAPPGRKR
ncbi:MAG: alpha/beta hydrolase [Chloroflexi bacterium]|nr:alpha/beta hydrolase [Chloroflexota bacterium]MCI0576575.1 alpha/beta hydrolase [Chloroflexota bacterium]MCI0643794.1 alpha/beta hydrolase [Chloroflexota bacterium]MCI0726907.1 alpha/beta hydrolase [Chloroflexota bacterium]